MNQNHSPQTEKFTYMLNDLNDHYSMRTQFDKKDDYHVRLTIWFGCLRNELRTAVNIDGSIHYGIVDCTLDGCIPDEDVKGIFPDDTEIQHISQREEDDLTSIAVTIHSGDGEMDRKEYIQKVKEVKKHMLDSEPVLEER